MNYYLFKPVIAHHDTSFACLVKMDIYHMIGVVYAKTPLWLSALHT